MNRYCLWITAIALLIALLSWLAKRNRPREPLRDVVFDEISEERLNEVGTGSDGYPWGTR